MILSMVLYIRTGPKHNIRPQSAIRDHIIYTLRNVYTQNTARACYAINNTNIYIIYRKCTSMLRYLRDEVAVLDVLVEEDLVLV